MSSQPSLSHFVIFSPAIQPPRTEGVSGELQDDLVEAAQILFYTSRQAGNVSRDTMLRQVGLVKGLMGFTEMVVKKPSKDWWSVRSHRSRMVVYSPEPDVYIHVNISLACNENNEPATTAQGLSDCVLVDGLRRGYQDFCLRHGLLTALLPTPTVSTTLEKFWTRFAFAYENEITSDTCLIGYPPPTAQRVVEEFMADTGMAHVGVINKDGPMYQTHRNDALSRFLHNLVQVSLPPEPKVEPRQTLGFGLKRKEERKSSWTTFGWPSLGKTSEAKTSEGQSSSSKWSLGDAMGTMGSALGLGNGQRDGRSLKETSNPTQAATSHGLLENAESSDSRVDHPVEEVDSSDVHLDPHDLSLIVQTHDPPKSHVDPPIADTSHLTLESHETSPQLHVEQTPVRLPDLEAAVQPEDEISLTWNRQTIHLETGPAWTEQSLAWVIRDNILLYVVSPETPSTRATLSLFSHLVTPPEETTANPTIIVADTVERIGEMDQTSSSALTELREMNTDEVYARTPSSKFVTVKRVEKNGTPGQLFMMVGRKDASLTDAEHAVRSFMRSRSDL